MFIPKGRDGIVAASQQGTLYFLAAVSLTLLWGTCLSLIKLPAADSGETRKSTILSMFLYWVPVGCRAESDTTEKRMQ